MTMMSIAVKTSVKRKGIQLLAPMVLMIAMLLPWAGARALPFTTDITITGTADFYYPWALAEDVDQTGSYSVRQGGVTTINDVNGTTVSDSTGTVIAPSMTALAASLTQTGDGFGVTASASSAVVGAEGEFPMVVGFSIFNSSVSSIYKMRLLLDYDHSVDASGADAYAISEYWLRDTTNGVDLLFRGVTSDSISGNVKNKALATDGVPVTDNGALFLDLIINPGELLDLALQYDLSSGVVAAGSFDASFTSFLSIASVGKVEGGVVPTPATLSLMLAGVLGLMASRRRDR